MNRTPAKCPQCRSRFTPEERGIRIHPACVDAWYEAHRQKQAKKAEAKRKKDVAADRKQTRAKLDGMKTIPMLIKEAQVAFNAFIRARDAAKPCICCDRPLGEGDVGGAYDCGHYRSTGSASHLRFDESNAHGQRKFCNRWGAGRAVDYRLGLLRRIGVAEVDRLESSNQAHKWQREELMGIKATYVQKLKELRKSAPCQEHPAP